VQSSSLLKMPSIIPIHKKNISLLNEDRPVALSSVAIKVSERTVLRYLTSLTDGLLELYQCTYQTDRSVDDAITLGLHHI